MDALCGHCGTRDLVDNFIRVRLNERSERVLMCPACGNPYEVVIMGEEEGADDG